MELERSNVETRTALPAPAIRRRVRTDVWWLKREAARRRHRANAVMLASLVGVCGLVKLFYVLLSR
jgi:hypothetical protein